MIRFLLYSLIAVFLITLVRAFVGIIMKGFAELVNPKDDSNVSAQNQSNMPMGGELKKDPVCGTYVSEHTSVKLSHRGQMVYFCSEGCMRKFHEQDG
jgi:YHS domain-containing protein